MSFSLIMALASMLLAIDVQVCGTLLEVWIAFFQNIFPHVVFCDLNLPLVFSRVEATVKALAHVWCWYQWSFPSCLCTVFSLWPKLVHDLEIAFWLPVENNCISSIVDELTYLFSCQGCYCTTSSMDILLPKVPLQPLTLEWAPSE